MGNTEEKLAYMREYMRKKRALKRVEKQKLEKPVETETAKPNIESVKESDCQKFRRIMRDKATGKISPTFDIILWLNSHACDCDDCAKWNAGNKAKTTPPRVDQWFKPPESEPVTNRRSDGVLDAQIQLNLERQDAETREKVEERNRLEGEKQQLLDALERRRKEQNRNLYQNGEEEKANA
jgi:hypothetical protein